MATQPDPKTPEAHASGFAPLSTALWLSPVLKPLKPLFFEVAAGSLFINLLALAAPIFVLQVYDRVVYHAGLSTLSGLAIGMVLVVAFDFVLRQMRARIMQAVSLNLDVKVGRRLFETVMALPLRTLEGRPLGYWQQLFRDIDVVRNTLSGSSAVLIFDLPFAILFMTLVFIIARPVAWVLLIALLAFMVLAWLSARHVGQTVGKEKESQQSRDALLAETVMGRTTIKALSLAEHLEPMWERKQSEHIEQSLVRGTLNDRYVNIAQSLTIITSVSMTTIGALSIIDQDMTIGGLVAANMLSGRLMSPLNQLVGAWRTYSTFRQSIQRLSGVFAMPQDNTVSKIAMPRPKGHLTLEKVAFRYRPDGKPVIEEISLDITAGGVTAIMGRNGCGKSTLLKVMLGLYPTASGRVLLDGADISQFTRRELANWMGYVPQESVLFAGSIRDNIAQGKPGATDEEILAAAHVAGVHQFVVDLPDGYGTNVGEAGGLLSGGMRQRIAIARALVGNPPILLMDEPSGSLDRQAEEQLRASLVELAKERCVVIVSHSPILLQGCRSLVVMDHGKVVCSGPTADVMRFLSSQQQAQGKGPSVPQPSAVAGEQA